MSEIVDIFDISYEGAGVGKIDGQIVFVPKTLPDEKVEVEIVKRTNSFLIGKCVNVLEGNDHRRLPQCPYFDICGGCDFQHCEYEYEQKLKAYILKKELSKIGFDGEGEYVSSPKRFSYRNKIKLEVENGKLGYFKAKSHKFFEVKTCPIASENIVNVLPKIEDFLSENDFKNLKNVYIKEADGDVAICFLFGKKDKKVQKNIKNLQILSDFCIFFAFGDILESNETLIFHVGGKHKLIKKYADFSSEIDVSAFNQINDDIAEKLYEFVTIKTAGQRVINAYSGQGLLTRLIAKKAKFVYGIELQKSSHESAQKLTENLQNVQNICGKVEDELGKILLRDRLDTIVLDPAREGCRKEALEAILKDRIDCVIYVSCNFATLIRDLKILLDKYTIENIKIFDMFPCTANMETVAILRAK